MRIGMFTDNYFPKINGVATSVLMLKKNLEAIGHDVYIITTTDPDAVKPEHNVIRIPSVPVKKQRLGIAINPAIYHYIRKLSLDIIHTHTEFTIGNVGKIMAKYLNKPAVHTMHTIYEYYSSYIISAQLFEPLINAITRKLTVVFCNGADTVIVPSSKTLSIIRDYGVRKPIRVIPTGIPLDRFAAEHYDAKKIAALRSELGIKEHNKVLINIGRVSHEKNLDKLMESLQGYMRIHPHVILLIVGDGPARKELEKLAEDLGIRTQVIFAGSRPWEDIHLYYRVGDIFIGASESETQGLTYIEAMASGRPVVAKEDACLNDILINDENGYLFNDAEKLTSAVDKLLSDAEMHKRFAAKAVVSVQRFSAESYARSVSDVYEKLAANR